MAKRRKSSGLMAAWAEQQRQQQRQFEAEARRQRAAQIEWERTQRAASRASVRDERERRRLYDEERELEARLSSQLIATQVAALESVLDVGLRSEPPNPQRLKVTATIPAFDAGPLANPIAVPDQSRYVAVPMSGLRGMTPAARRQYEAAQVEARAAFERDWHAAQQAEAARQLQLAAYHDQYAAWAQGERDRAAQQNAEVDELLLRLSKGEPAAVADFVSAILYSGAGWPEAFPRDVQAAFDPASGQLVLNWELPGPEVIPQVDRVRYVKSTQRDIEHARPAAEIRQLYRLLLARCTLRVLFEIFRAEPYGHVRSVAFNGMVNAPDPTTGRLATFCLVSCIATRSAFATINLQQVDALRCVESLQGHVSPRPDQLVAVRPVRLPASVGSPVTDQADDDLDLFEMDPIDFEDLVAALFKAMNFQVMTTARTGDGGVDVLATDFDPVRGGRIVIQVKRYAATVNPTAVRDLFGTVQHEGAIKGILVTTSGFGPGSREFADGKPLTLIDGPELVRLLHQHGLSGHLGPTGPTVQHSAGRHSAPE